MPTKEDMVDLLLSKAEGKIIACNIIDGINVSVEEPTIKEFMTLWFKKYSKESSMNLQKLIGLLTITAEEYRDPSPGDNFYGSGKQVSDNEDKNKFHTSITYNNLIVYVLDKTKFQEALGVGSPAIPIYSDESNAAWDRLISKYRSGEMTVNTNIDKSIGKKNGVFWVTPCTDISKCLEIDNGIKRANRIREISGLIDIYPNNSKGDPPTVLMGITLDEEDLVGRARPCFIDAGSHSRFKTIADSDENQKKKQWGYTVDLKSLKNNSVVVDGVRECVAKSIPCSSKQSIQLTLIGRVLSDIGNTPVDMESFSDRLLAGRNLSDIKNELLKFL